MTDRPQFLRTPPVHLDFLRAIDELEASQQCTEEFTHKTSPPYDEERRTWYWASPSGGRQAG